MKVLIYPRSENPYHELLYGQLRTSHPDDTFTYLPASARTLSLFPWILLAKRLQGFRLFHLHWHTFYIDRKYGLPGAQGISFIYTWLCLSIIKILGYKIIWTVHNVVPHEPKTTNDAFIARYTARLASQLIVHSKHTLQELKATGIPATKVTINPHGNYAGVYPVKMTRLAARKKIGIKAGERVIFFFGAIRPYKGIEGLLEAFSKLESSNNLRLLIAGACLDNDLRKVIRGAARRDRRIIFADKLIPVKDVAMYFSASDIVCLPFTAVTTSGTALLAMTFGKPLVAPRSGAIKDLPSSVGVLYNPDRKNALSHGLTRMLSADTDVTAMQKAAAAYAASLNWQTIAARTHDIYEATL